MKDELELLRHENERLKYIIALLAQQVRQGNKTVDADVLKGDDPVHVEDAYLRKEDEAVHLSDSYVFKGNASGQMSDTYLRKEDKEIQVSGTDVLKGDDSAQVSDADVSAGIEQKQFLSTNSSQEIATKQPFSDVGTLSNEQKAQLANYLKWDLQPLMLHSRQTGLDSAAQLLVHIHSKQKNTAMQLRHVTGLSKSGLAKQLMGLCKRGLLARAGFQQYTVSGRGMKMLEDAWSKV